LALAPGTAHRTSLTLLITGPLVGLAWVAAAGTGPGWADRIGSVLAAMPYFPLILAVTVPAAVLAAACGRVALRRHSGSRMAIGAALVATLGCAAGDVTLVAATTGRVLAGAQSVTVWAAVAIAASAVRLAAAIIASARLGRWRAAGH